MIDGALVRSTLRAADASFEAADVLIEPDIAQPQDPSKTGSSASLVKWDEMGRWGRHFVASAPSVEDIAEFQSGPVKEPVRVYVGRSSADTADARADLALQELIRVGGFDRSVLVVMVPVGTGWMDPGAHDTLDFMLAGDVATVSVQYSYLDQHAGSAGTSGLRRCPVPGPVRQDLRTYWTTLPKDDRPQFYVHGLSQGAFIIPGDTSPFRHAWEIRSMAPCGPALRFFPGTGPRCAINATKAVRRGARHSAMAHWCASWISMAALMAITGPGDRSKPFFLNYGSDPIVNFTFDSAVRPPAWLNQPRAPDVSERLSWFPVVTMLQLALDSMFALDVPRFGHYYVAPDYIDAWAAVVEPEGWSRQRADQLKEIFSRRGPAF